MARTRIVSFLGAPPRGYQATTYAWEDEEGAGACRTPLMVRALYERERQRGADPIEVKVLATKKAKSENGALLRDELIQAGADPEAVLELIDIPDGSGEAELWDLFAYLTEVLDIGTKDRNGDERDRVILDVTFGFRTQSFFAGAVASYLRACGSKTDIQIVYGAYEARCDDRTPIWDLTAFVEVQDWAFDILLFLRSGQSRGIARRTEQLGKKLQRAWYEDGQHGPQPRIAELGKALERFGDDFVTVRTGPTRNGNRPGLLLGTGKQPSSAAQLAGVLRQIGGDLPRSLRPLQRILDDVRKMAEDLTTDDLRSAKGHHALVALAERYMETGRYAEAAAAIREGWISLHGEPAACRPGLPDYDEDARRRAEAAWRRTLEDRARIIADVRNDIEHAGYRKQPQAPDVLVRRLRNELLEPFREAAVPDSPAQPPRRDVFLNLSNHPSETWSDAQRKAALAWGERIVDLPFPAVAPDADDDDVTALAAAVLRRVPEETGAAMVMGEFALTLHLVRGLQERGVTCLAATSARDEEATGPDERTSRFRFVRFRTYPPLAGA